MGYWRDSANQYAIQYIQKAGFDYYPRLNEIQLSRDYINEAVHDFYLI